MLQDSMLIIQLAPTQIESFSFSVEGLAKEPWSGESIEQEVTDQPLTRVVVSRVPDLVTFCYFVTYLAR